MRSVNVFVPSAAKFKQCCRLVLHPDIKVFNSAMHVPRDVENAVVVLQVDPQGNLRDPIADDFQRVAMNHVAVHGPFSPHSANAFTLSKLRTLFVASDVGRDDDIVAFRSFVNVLRSSSDVSHIYTGVMCDWHDEDRIYWNLLQMQHAYRMM